MIEPTSILVIIAIYWVLKILAIGLLVGSIVLTGCCILENGVR